VLSRRRQRLDALAEEIRGRGGQAYVLAGDLRDPAYPPKAVAEFIAHVGRLDLLVNNAGAPTPSTNEVATDQQFDDVFALNVRAMYRLSLLALPFLRETKGSIINVSSAGVARNVTFDLVYLASKGAVEALSRGLAKKWAPLAVRVNVVAPGIVPTEIVQTTGLSPEEARRQVAEAVQLLQPLPHAGHVEDIARAVQFLASEEAEFITGATLHVDGGMAVGG
jgi:NAD(P)-dependent dehydrogenase (short-subunit alcohol dehydrogenase family)